MSFALNLNLIMGFSSDVIKRIILRFDSYFSHVVVAGSCEVSSAGGVVV